MAKYYVTGTYEGIDDPREYLKKEMEFHRSNPNELKSQWKKSELLSSFGEFDLEIALAKHMADIIFDIEEDAVYTISEKADASEFT